MLERLESTTSAVGSGWTPAEPRTVIRTDIRAPAAARAALQVTAAGIPGAILADAELLTSELVTNSVVHSGAPVAIPSIALDADRLRIEVADQGASRIRHRRPGADGGWGLTFVSELADRWGAGREGGFNIAWFELDLITHRSSGHDNGRRLGLDPAAPGPAPASETESPTDRAFGRCAG